MNLAIKALEKIGQSTSIKQYDSLQDMVDTMKLNVKSFDNLNKKEIICVHISDDDDD